MPPKAKLTDLATALESDGMEEAHITRFDRDTGKMVYLEAAVLRSVEEDPDYDGSDLPDWPAQSSAMRRAGQRREVETARALLADDGTRFIDPPHRDTHDEFEVKQNADVPGDVQELLAAIVR